jgi:hypothetical protein
MVFRTRERGDGDFEVAVDSEGIDYLEQGLCELRRMAEGEAIASPALDVDGVSRFILKRVPDDGG